MHEAFQIMISLTVTGSRPPMIKLCLMWGRIVCCGAFVDHIVLPILGDHGATPWACTKQLQQVVDELGFAGQVVPTSAETIYTNLVMQRERG